MANIQVLDDKTINQIAAGEVVERPVSVVKELVENSIDSGASNISVEIKDGGISLIRVTDNGSGIDKNNIKTAFLRHATSKITSIEDLLSVKSLGFRGEALSSIAAVAQIELLTKVKGELFGYRYMISGGKEQSFDEAGIPDGTTMLVRNLFFNTPARRKFLKSPLAEGNLITELMERMILSHPDIGFRYIINGKEKLSSVGNSEIKQNIYSIFGREVASLVIPIEYENESIRITGFIGKPETSRGNRNFELFFVNNRYVKSGIISRTVEEAYSNYLMLHKYPLVILYFEIDQENLDVNVHPAKTEIRFLKEDELKKGILEAIISGLSHKEMIPEVSVDKESISKYLPRAEVSSKFESDNVRNAVVSIEKEDFSKIEEVDEKNSYSKEEIVTPEPYELKKLETYVQKKQEELKEFEVLTDVEQEKLFDEGFLNVKNSIRHKIIGQVFDTYWIVELDEKMYIIDQHAAHEKVLYERFKRRIDEDNVYSQTISPSIIVSLSSSEIDVFNKYRDNFIKLGFEVESFGGKEFAISAVPVDLFGLNEKELFISVLDELATTNRISDIKAVNDRIATMACKAAIKGNMHFSLEEARALIDELLTLENPYNCPHGRPTIISYSKTEIEKLFKRIV